jgi:hypothetical protein
MTFEYTLTLADIATFQWYSAKHIPRVRRIRWIAGGICIALGLCLLLAAWWLAARAPAYDLTRPGVRIGRMLRDWGPVIGLGLVGLGWLLGITMFLAARPGAFQDQVKRQAHTKAIRQLLGLHQFTITPARYTITTTTSERKQDWEALDSVYLSDAACYLFISPYEAVIVPRRGIEPAMEWPAFCDYIRLYTAALTTKASREPDEGMSNP